MDFFLGKGEVLIPLMGVGDVPVVVVVVVPDAVGTRVTVILVGVEGAVNVLSVTTITFALRHHTELK